MYTLYECLGFCFFPLLHVHYLISVYRNLSRTSVGNATLNSLSINSGGLLSYMSVGWVCFYMPGILSLHPSPLLMVLDLHVHLSKLYIEVFHLTMYQKGKFN